MEEQIAKLLKVLTGFGSQRMEDVGVPSFMFVMGISLACALFVSYLYRYFYSGRATGSQIHRAFPLLGISITAIFICIQFSLPLSLGLLGALSIVRFRTPVKEPEEIGFIMLLIAVSITCATFNFVFLGILLFSAIIVLLVLQYGPSALSHPLNEGVIVVSLSEQEYVTKHVALMEYLESKLSKGRVESISKNGSESVISYNFRGLKQKTLMELQNDLNDLVGSASYNIFLNQQGIA
jgi:hypothetical protein